MALAFEYIDLTEPKRRNIVPKKAVKEDAEDEVNEVELNAVSGLILARDLGRRLFGDALTAKLAIDLYDHLVDDEGEIDEASLDDFMKAKEVTEEEIFKGMSPSPQDIIDVYVRMFVDLDEEDEDDED